MCGPDTLAETVRTRSGGEGADLVLELTGNSAAAAPLPLLGLGGRLALVGSVYPAPEVCFEPSTVVRGVASIIGSHNYRLDDLAGAVGFLAGLPEPALFAELVSAPFPLSEIEAAFAEAHRGTAARVAVVPDRGGPACPFVQGDRTWPGVPSRS